MDLQGLFPLYLFVCFWEISLQLQQLDYFKLENIEICPLSSPCISEAWKWNMRINSRMKLWSNDRIENNTNKPTDKIQAIKIFCFGESMWKTIKNEKKRQCSIGIDECVVCNKALRKSAYEINDIDRMQSKYLNTFCPLI